MNSIMTAFRTEHTSKVGVRVFSIGLVAMLVLSVTAQAGTERIDPRERFDLLIKGGRVLDGSGNPWFYADIGIKNGMIAGVGHFDEASAHRTLNAKGKFVVPGFIDLHSHADDGRVEHGLRDTNNRRRAAPNLVSQGITTAVINPDGFSPWPISKQRDELERMKIGLNVALMVGHNTLRKLTMGTDVRRPATPDEIEHMRQLVRAGMGDGAFGLTAALEYSPGIWSTTDELVALVQEVAPFGGIFSEHERSSGDAPMWWSPSKGDPNPPTSIDSVKETIQIGQRTGVPVVLTHLKTRGVNSWGTSRTVIQLVEDARSQGVEVWADQYPYNSTDSDGSIVLLPPWSITPDAQKAYADTPGSIKNSYSDMFRHYLSTLSSSSTEKLRNDIAHAIELRGGAENILVFEYPDQAYIGKSLAALADAHHTDSIGMAMRLQLEGFGDRPGGARLRGFSLSEPDVEAYAAQPWVATSTDALIALPEDGDNIHPRYYGSFPRKLRYYAIERRVLSIEAAVRSGTSLPAQILGLSDRGMIREGCWADIVVLDLEHLRDRSTFWKPHQYAEGIEYVLVNGSLVVDDGKLTWSLPGSVLRRSARPPSGTN